MRVSESVASINRTNKSSTNSSSSSSGANSSSSSSSTQIRGDSLGHLRPHWDAAELKRLPDAFESIAQHNAAFFLLGKMHVKYMPYAYIISIIAIEFQLNV